MSRLKHLARLEYGDALAADQRTDGEFPVFGSNGQVGTHDQSNTKGPVILVGRKGSFGKVTWSETPGFCIDTAYFIDERSAYGDMRFTYYALQALCLNDVSRDTGIPGLSREDAHNRSLIIPSIDKQKELAAYLDGETNRIDDLIAEKNSFNDLLREKRIAAISHAVTKGIDKNAPMKPSSQDWLGDVPDHWDAVRLGVIFKEANRIGSSDLPVLSVSIHAGVSDEEIANEDRDRKVALSEDRSKYQGVMPGDLVYNMMRAWQGAFGAVASEGLVSPAYVVARPVSDARTKFIELQLRTPQAIEEMRRYSKGIADFRMRLYWEHFRNVAVALPPLDEQDAILKHIDRETNRIDSLIHETECSIALLKEKRTALITAAVTGKIDVRSAA
jgi:type I restriction enzyme S subunit